MIKRVIFAFAAFLVCQATAVAKGPLQPFNVGLWEAGAYTDDAGRFDSCMAGAPYRSGITVLVAIYKDWTWALGFTHESWSLTKGQKIPIKFTFDRRARFDVVGTATAQNFVFVPMPAKSDLINAFRRAFVMSVVAQGQTFSFDLAATSQLLPALSRCVADNLGGPAPAGTPRLTSDGGSPASPNAEAAELQMEAMQLATNFILATRLNNPKVLSRADTPVSLASFGAAWKSDEAIGAVKIVPPDGGLTKGIDVAAAIAAERC